MTVMIDELNAIWAAALRRHAQNEIEGWSGIKLPIRPKELSMLESLWSRGREIPDLGPMIAQGRDVRFWSDPHFNHRNILELAKRDCFSSVEEMDSVIMKNVDDAMQDADIVFCLGDIAMYKPIQYQRNMARDYGSKHLFMIGNHDIKGTSSKSQWVDAGALASLAFTLPRELVRQWVTENEPDMASMLEWDQLDDDIHFGCSHWPVPPERMPEGSWVNIHGHVHQNPGYRCGINVCVEAINYAPRQLRELVSVDLIDEIIQFSSENRKETAYV